jgi:hypothetical protein
VHRHLRPFITAALLIAAGSSTAGAQQYDPVTGQVIPGTYPTYDPVTGASLDPYTGLPYPSSGSVDPYTGQPYPTTTPTYTDPGTSSYYEPAAPVAGVAGTLVCSGDWRYPLTEMRQEIGPARFARQRDLQRDLALTGAAVGYCEEAAANGFADRYADVAGPCYGLLVVADKMDVAASNLFSVDDANVTRCLTQAARSGGDCEGERNLLTTLRTYDKIAVDRAELVLGYQVCASPERRTNAGLRGACEALEQTVAAEASEDAVYLGQFSLTAPLPPAVAGSIDTVRDLTDGRYLSAMPENAAGIRRSMCKLKAKEAAGDEFTGILDRDPFVKNKAEQVFGPKGGAMIWSMCNELGIAVGAASTCRKADIYIDERGELHLNSPLTSRKSRKDATLCIDVSDFHPDQPLMVTIGLDSTGSVPERVWPGETMHIGHLIDQPATREDVMALHVYGKAIGVSLSEVLRINGVTDVASERDEACRMARSWVPVVDHEVPIGDPERQAIIPIEYGRGRVGETQRIDENDYVVLWVKDIEPSGSVMVEYASGQYVGYQPPPLLGQSDGAAALSGGSGDIDPNTGLPYPGTDALAAPASQAETTLAMRGASVDQPLLPRRARYPGSRVLRLGTPKGNYEYPLRVCTREGAVPASTTSSGGCSGGKVIVEERFFVHGDYHLGLRMYFGYTSFPTPQYSSRPLGGDSYEVLQTGANTAEYDIAVLLAAYPFGRDPRRFSYNPLSKAYWKGAALLAGFGLRRIKRPWDDFYMGGSLPVANGVSFTLLAHVGQRGLPMDIRAGDMFTSTTNGNVDDAYAEQDAIVVGASFGLSFDYDLFERAFSTIAAKFTGGTQVFMSSGDNDSSSPEDFQ